LARGAARDSWRWPRRRAGGLAVVGPQVLWPGRMQKLSAKRIEVDSTGRGGGAGQAADLIGRRVPRRPGDLAVRTPTVACAWTGRRGRGGTLPVGDAVGGQSPRGCGRRPGRRGGTHRLARRILLKPCGPRRVRRQAGGQLSSGFAGAGLGGDGASRLRGRGSGVPLSNPAGSDCQPRRVRRSPRGDPGGVGPESRFKGGPGDALGLTPVVRIGRCLTGDHPAGPRRPGARRQTPALWASGGLSVGWSFVLSF